MTLYRLVQAVLLSTVLVCQLANSQSWQPLTNKPPFYNMVTMLLLRDGRVLAHVESTPNWLILTPDSTGSYVNGTWSMAASMPTGYGPHAFSSAVLPDGRVIVEGGEYLNGNPNPVWSNLGAIYDPRADQWTPVNPPTGWKTIGDAASVVLFNGIYMQANCCTKQVALFNENDLTWTPTGSTLQQNNNEVGWAMLPDGRVLMVDGEPACSSNTASEIYDPNAGTWSCGPQLPVQLWGSDNEPGSTVLMYNNKVLQFGGIPSATAILDLSTDTWSVGPNPGFYNQDDGPSALEPNGKVLALLSSTDAVVGCQFMEYDPNLNLLSDAPNPPECPFHMKATQGRLLVLPTGQILFAHFTSSIEIYTPAPGVVAGAAPTIALSTGRLIAKSVNNVLYGTQLNGLSETNMQGDDAQQATNYPLVQLRDLNTGIVWWARTHDDSSHSIAPHAVGYTKFDLNPNMPSGQFQLVVITNGIASNPLPVTVIAPLDEEDGRQGKLRLE